MATCPHCDSDITEWAQRLESSEGANTPMVWTCPECDTIIGISDWGAVAKQPPQ